MVGVSNFRHAQYDAQGVGIDDPQALRRQAEIDLATGALVGPDGWSLVGGKGPSGNRLVVLGDSITAFGGLPASPTAVTAVGNVVTINLTNHGESVGNLGVLHLATQVEYNGVWLVDSVIDANNFTVRVTNAPTVSPATGPRVWISSRSTTSLSYWTWADFLLGGPFDIQANAGVGSNTTAEILARLDADVLSLRPNIVIALAGTNDVRYVQTPASMELAWENLQQIYARVLSSGALLVVCSVLPVSSADSGAATVLPLQRALNARIAAYASATANVVFADTYAAIVDSASADGRALTSMLSDSVHPNAVGAYLVGKALAAALAPIAFTRAPLISSNADVYSVSALSKNRLSNPLMVNSGGTLGAGVTSASGGTTGIAQGWQAARTGAATAVVSLVDRTVADDGDALGKKQRIEATGTADGETVTLSLITGVTPFAAGDVIYSDFIFSVNSASNVKYILANLVCATSIGNFTIWHNAGSANGYPNAQAPFSGVVRTRDFKVPGGAVVTGVNLSVVVGFAGVGNATIDVSRVRVATA